jgi:CTP:molybdopterin cytidylyltransferase MocA
MSVMVAILAAGRASRFGGGKLDALCAGKPLGQWVLDAVVASGAAPGLIVVGPDAPAFTQEAMLDGWTLATNPAPEEGLGGSVALAARHAECLGCDALLLLLADMPLVTPEVITALLAAAAGPVAVRYPSGRPGVPARFPAAMFAELAELDGDRGAAVLLKDRADLAFVETSPDMLTDVDDPAGLIRAEALLLR